MDFEFDTKKVQNTHFHQDLGDTVCGWMAGLKSKIESEKYELGKGDFLLINANKRQFDPGDRRRTPDSEFSY